MTRRRTAGTVLVTAGSAVAVALTGHTLVNLRRLRTPTPDPPPVAERVSVLLPVRDEAERVAPCLASVLAQRRLADLEVVVLDDGSRDGTADVVRRVAGDDPRLRLLAGPDAAPPPGWLGKPHACARLAEAATGDVLVFVDADVVLSPVAVAATVAVVRGAGLDLVSPYPRQQVSGLGQRLVQPLLQWSWLTTLPLGLAERPGHPSLAAANGQLLAVDRQAYERAGGHAAVRGEVVDDVALLRVVKRAGGRGTVVDGTHLATCRMYDGWDDLVDGYAKSLWAAFGSPLGAAATTGLLGLAYVVPPAAALLSRDRRTAVVGAIGYAAGVAGRVAVARRTGQHAWPDAAAHPLSIAMLAWLTALSFARRRRGTLTWKRRAIR
jgi:hypothetical protein